jgi:2Fe-2S ferredoxin
MLHSTSAREDATAKVSYVQPDTRRDTLDLREGLSLMQGATGNGIDGIVAECGGNCLCATRHVYVEPAQLALLRAISAEEDALLDSTAAERLPNSRLSGQIRVTPDPDGLVIHLPDRRI